jgi:flagellum-specific ATP synthase
MATITTNPIADAVRGILDGHITLSRRDRRAGAVPGGGRAEIDLAPAERCCRGRGRRDIARKARKLISLYSNMEELVRIGAYAKGADAEVDEAVRLWPQIEAFLQQDVHEVTTPDDAIAMLEAVLAPQQASQQQVPVNKGLRR